MLINKLRKCPFCGGDPWVNYDEITHAVFVECKECHAMSRKARVKPKDEPITFETMDEAEAFVYGAWERSPED